MQVQCSAEKPFGEDIDKADDGRATAETSSVVARIGIPDRNAIVVEKETAEHCLKNKAIALGLATIMTLTPAHLGAWSPNGPLDLDDMSLPNSAGYFV